MNLYLGFKNNKVRIVSLNYKIWCKTIQLFGLIINKKNSIFYILCTAMDGWMGKNIHKIYQWSQNIQKLSFSKNIIQNILITRFWKYNKKITIF